MPTDSATLDEHTVYVRVLDFTAAPGPRHRSESSDADSGEQFRDEVLLPAYEKARTEGTKLVVDLDGTAGYASSFLEESFGGLARIFPPSDVLATIEIVSATRPWYVEEVMEEYIPEARLVRS